MTRGDAQSQSWNENDEDLSDDEPWTLGPQLAQLLASSDRLDRDVSNQVDRHLRGRSAMTDVLDLLSLGWSTMRVLLIDDTTSADSEGEGH